jgi:hypothetical protein
MADESNKEIEVRTLRDAPLILDKVEYVYVSYSQLSASNHDFRIAFGDRIPPEGTVKPVIGLIMSHNHARALLEVLEANIPKIQAAFDADAIKDAAAIHPLPSPTDEAPKV